MATRKALGMGVALPSGPFAMTEESYRLLANAAAFSRFPNSPEALLSARQQWLEGSVSTLIRDGVATIPVRGPLMKSFSWLSWYFGAACYEQIALDLERSIEDSRVELVVLDINSPGGETAGLDEITDRIFVARERKPIKALISGTGASAAYSLAAAAHEVITTPGSVVGCIGTVVEGEDWSGFDEKMGIKRWRVVSSQSPKKRLDPTSKAGQSEIQQMVDAIADVMITAIAKHRATSVENVLENYGQGGVLVGDAAVQAGLADRLGTSDSIHAELSAAAAASTPLYVRATMNNNPKGSAAPPGVRAEGDKDEKKEDEPKVNADDKKKDGEDEEPKADARVKSVAVLAMLYPALVSAIRAEGATSERTRISAIEALKRPGLETVIKGCIDDASCTPEAAAMRILQHEKSQRSAHLGALASDEEKLDKPKNTATDTEGSGDDSVVGRITATYDKHRGGRRTTAGRN